MGNSYRIVKYSWGYKGSLNRTLILIILGEELLLLQ
jgi:hypothetical protein